MKKQFTKLSLRGFGQASQSIRLLLLACATCVLGLSMIATAQAQRYSKTFPTKGGNVKLQLNNRAGTVVVSGWAKSEIKVVATMEAPYANCSPEMRGEDLIIDLVSDNRGRGDVGNVRFDISVPYSAKVDIETKLGDVKINNIQGSLVRAHVTSEGDITLTNIRSENVMAENISGDIFFDGELKIGGRYKFNSIQGNINIRIPQNSAFNLVASAPGSRKIFLGSFAGAGLSYLSDGRKVVGSVGDGKSSLNIENQRGSITFLRR